MESFIIEINYFYIYIPKYFNNAHCVLQISNVKKYLFKRMIIPFGGICFKNKRVVLNYLRVISFCNFSKECERFSLDKLIKPRLCPTE